MIKATDIAMEAKSWVGTPYVHQARLKGVGVDCIGLVLEVGRNLGVVDFDYADYSMMPDGVTLMERVRKHFVPGGSPMPGAIGVFKWRVHPQHFCVFGECNGVLTIIHAWQRTDRCVEVSFDKVWRGRLASVWHFPGVAY